MGHHSKWILQFSSLEYWSHLCNSGSLLKKADEQYEVKNPQWIAFFAPGTRLSEWEGPPPSAEELLEAIKKQSLYIDEFFVGRLDDAASESFEIKTHIMDTVDAFLQFVTWHDGVHAGIIKEIG